MMTFRRWIIWSAALGLVAPGVWFVLLSLDAMWDWRFGLLFRLWPSSIWMMATDGIEGTPRAYEFIALAVIANVVLYSLVGTLAWSVFAAARRPRRRADRPSFWVSFLLWLLFVVIGVVL